MAFSPPWPRLFASVARYSCLCFSFNRGSIVSIRCLVALSTAFQL
jgi:hypothetical protein